jgi:hypothetical protein
MKAWQQLESDPNITLYHYGTSENKSSEYYIDHGVRIEKMRDGSITIKNCMLAGDFYKEVSSHEYNVFETKGWLEGCYNVCINTLESKLEKCNYLIKHMKNHDELIDRRNVLEEKILRYKELSKNLSKFATN